MVRRILFVTTGFDQVTNGPGVYTKNLWQFFSEDSDIEFHVVALESKLQHDRLHLVGYRPQGFGSKTYQAISELTEQVLCKLGPDTILHANMAHVITPKLAASQRSIVQINDTEVCSWKPSLANLSRHGLRRNAALSWRKSRERAVTRNANLTICNSNHTAAHVTRAYKLHTASVRTIYKAIDLTRFASATQSDFDRTPNEPSQLVFIGTNWRLKGLDVLLRAIRGLVDRQINVRLSAYGNPSPTIKNEFTSLAEMLGISEVVNFRGRIESSQVPATMASADLLVLPSRSEALGLVVIEALAAGTPAVASNVGGIPEVVVDKICGSLVPPEEPEALAAAIESSLQKPSPLADRLHRQAAVSRFSAARLREELIELYHSPELR